MNRHTMTFEEFQARLDQGNGPTADREFYDKALAAGVSFHDESAVGQYAWTLKEQEEHAGRQGSDLWVTCYGVASYFPAGAR